MKTHLLRLTLALTLVLALGTTAWAAGAAAPQVVFETSQGAITVELWPDKAPVTVKNFLRYVDEKYYDGLIFHRVIDNFMIQGGGFTPDLRPRKTHAPIKLEAGADNARGTLAMARTSDPNSATSQFFINVVDNPRLNSYGGGYAVFGKVVKGMDVVDRIKALPTRRQGQHANLPVETVLIKSARRVVVEAPKKPAAAAPAAPVKKKGDAAKKPAGK